MPPSWQQAFCYFACLPEREHISFDTASPVMLSWLNCDDYRNRDAMRYTMQAGIDAPLDY
jgi:hypothetical protein